jgi:hypothetical protein
MSLTAVGGVFEQRGDGVGVNSSADDGVDFGNKWRINSSFGEEIRVGFNRSVVLNSVDLMFFGRYHRLVLTAVEGSNPFSDLAGYTDNYSIDGASLTYTHRGLAGGVRVPFGSSGREPVVIPAGTVLAFIITSKKS